MWYRGKEYASTSELYTGLFNILYSNTNPLIRDTAEMQAILDVQATQLCDFLWAKDELFTQVYKSIDLSTTSNYIGSMMEYETAFNLPVDDVDSLSYQEKRRKRIQERLKNKVPYTLLDIKKLLEKYGIYCKLYLGNTSTKYTTLYAECPPTSVEGKTDLLRQLDNMIPMNITLSLSDSDNVLKSISTKLRSDKTTTPYVLNGTYVLERNEQFIDSEENILYDVGEKTLSIEEISSIIYNLVDYATVTAFANTSTALATPTVAVHLGSDDTVDYDVVVPSSVNPLNNIVIKTENEDTFVYVREEAHSTELTITIQTKYQNGVVTGEVNEGLTKGVHANKLEYYKNGVATLVNLTYSNGEYVSDLISAGANDVVITDISILDDSLDPDDPIYLATYDDKTFTLKAGASTNLYWSITD